MPVCVVGGDQDTTVGVHNILAEYLALPEPRRFLHTFHSIGHSPNVEVATRCAGVLDRFVSHTVPQYLSSRAKRYITLAGAETVASLTARDGHRSPVS